MGGLILEDFLLALLVDLEDLLFLARRVVGDGERFSSSWSKSSGSVSGTASLQFAAKVLIDKIVRRK